VVRQLGQTTCLESLIVNKPEKFLIKVNIGLNQVNSTPFTGVYYHRPMA